MKTLKLNIEKVLFAIILLLLSVSLFSQNTISSVASGAWNNPMIWDCQCVPTAADDVIINPYNLVEVTSDAYTNYLSVEPNGQLIMNQAYSLYIGGDFDLIGTLTATNGTIVLDGDSEQYVDAGGSTVNFNNLAINNSGTENVTFYEATYRVQGTLYPTSGNMVIDPTTNNHFIISSNSNGHGRIDLMGTGFTLSGEVEVETYIAPGINGPRDLSSPVKTATFSMWDANLNLFGPGMPDGCTPWSEACDGTVKKYINNVYVDITNINDSIVNGKGYELILGDDSTSFNGSTIVSKGTLNCSLDITLSIDSNWNIAGNPYVSAIDFDYLTRNGVTNYFYIYSTESGSYEWYDGSTSTSSCTELANGIIPMGQGFYVEGAGTLTFTQAAKTTTTAELIKTTNDGIIPIIITNESNGFHTTSALEANSLATDGYDNGLDLTALITGKEKAPSLCFITPEKLLRKNNIAQNNETKSFPLSILIKNSGTHTISIDNTNLPTAHRHIFLYDHLTNERIDLKTGNYSFDASVGTYNDRFTLVLTNETQNIFTTNQNDNPAESVSQIRVSQEESTLIISNENEMEAGTIKIYSLSGQEVELDESTIEAGQVLTISFPSNLAGMYLVTIETSLGITTKKCVF